MILFLLLYCLQAEARIISLLSSKEIAIDRAGTNCEPGAMAAIFSWDDESEAIGYAEITGTVEDRACRATILTHSKSALIREGDKTEFIDMHRRVPNLPARYDLLREGRKKVAVRFKPLIYAGYSYGYTAASLDKGEFLLGLGPLAYGITDRLQIDTIPLGYVTNLANLGAKYQFYRDEDNRLSLHLTGTRFTNIGKGSWWAELQYDSMSNSRSMTHTKLRYTSKLPDTFFLENKDKKNQPTAEISTVYEWMFPSWHRVLLGPKFTAGEEKDVGFLLSSLFLYEHFHWSVNLAMNSLRKLDFGRNQQVVSFDFFWRF